LNQKTTFGDDNKNNLILFSNAVTNFASTVSDLEVLCHQHCSENYDPVCGSNGKTYGNQCFMDIAICEERKNGVNLYVIYSGSCGRPICCAQLLFRSSCLFCCHNLIQAPLSAVTAPKISSSQIWDLFNDSKCSSCTANSD
jgi:hypothetical protein